MPVFAATEKSVYHQSITEVSFAFLISVFAVTKKSVCHFSITEVSFAFL